MKKIDTYTYSQWNGELKHSNQIVDDYLTDSFQGVTNKAERFIKFGNALKMLPMQNNAPI